MNSNHGQDNKAENRLNVQEMVNKYAVKSGFQLHKLLNGREEDENYRFLLLSIYFYLKHNNHHATADIFFNEANMGQVFEFPQDLGEPKNEFEVMKKKFTNYFYYNTFFQQSDTCDFLSDFWNQFWDTFVNKIKQSNRSGSEVDKYLVNKSLTLTYNLDTLHGK